MKSTKPKSKKETKKRAATPKRKEISPTNDDEDKKYNVAAGASPVSTSSGGSPSTADSNKLGTKSTKLKDPSSVTGPQLSSASTKSDGLQSSQQISSDVSGSQATSSTQAHTRKKPPPPPVPARLSHKLVLARSRNPKYPIRTGARRPTFKFDDLLEGNKYLEAETAAERRQKRKLKYKLRKMQGAGPAAKDQETSTEGSASTKERLLERPAFEERLKARQPKLNSWEAVCEKVRSEKAELDLILLKIGLPPHNFKKDKSFPFKSYSSPPELETCTVKDYVDYYVFPCLLAAIQSLIIFARRNRVLQCVHCTFNPADYLTEYLYNNNPNHPERMESPAPLNEIPFAVEWIRKYPRKPLPKWLTMNPDHAARIIQRAVRGWLVRKREEVHEMREFWKTYQKGMGKDWGRGLESIESLWPALSPYYDFELMGEDHGVNNRGELWGEGYGELLGEDAPRPSRLSHSDTCFICLEFRQALQDPEQLRIRFQKRSSTR